MNPTPGPGSGRHAGGADDAVGDGRGVDDTAAEDVDVVSRETHHRIGGASGGITGDRGGRHRVAELGDGIKVATEGEAVAKPVEAKDAGITACR